MHRQKRHRFESLFKSWLARSTIGYSKIQIKLFQLLAYEVGHVFPKIFTITPNPGLNFDLFSFMHFSSTVYYRLLKVKVPLTKKIFEVKHVQLHILVIKRFDLS